MTLITRVTKISYREYWEDGKRERHGSQTPTTRALHSRYESWHFLHRINGMLERWQGQDMEVKLQPSEHCHSQYE